MAIQKHSVLLGIAERVVSFLAVFAIALIWVGSTRQKVQQKVTTLESDVATMKEEWKERDKHITQMDLEGSVATKNFVQHYNEEQTKQYKRLEKLEEETSHLEAMELRIKMLEKNHGMKPAGGISP